MKEKREPWLKWFPSDWRADPRLRMCSLAARGLWIELLGFMHEAEQHGYLTIAGAAPSEDEIASLVGAPPAGVKKALAELEARGVFSRTDDGVIYSRRMLRDREKAEKDRANGKRGGNPKLREEDNPELDLGVNPPDKAQRPEARGQNPPSKPPEVLDDAMRAWAAEEAPHVRDLQRELDSYRDWKRSKGRRHTDERAGFRNWLRKAEKFVIERGDLPAPARGGVVVSLQDPEASQQRAAIESYLRTGQWGSFDRSRYGEPPGQSGNRMRPAIVAEYRDRLGARKAS